MGPSGKEGKTAARIKTRIPRPACPACGTEMRDVLYYPPSGRHKKALQCEKCWTIRLIST
jgi:hypothetical protein